MQQAEARRADCNLKTGGTKRIVSRRTEVNIYQYHHERRGLTSKLKAENGWNEFKGTLNCKEEKRKVLSVFLLLRAVFC